MHTENIDRWEHGHAFGQDRAHAGERRTLLVAGITLVTMVVEIVAGIAYGSMALLADGLHMGSHAVGIGISAFAYLYARRHAHNPEFSFGTGKVNSLAGYTGALLLVGFALVIGWESVARAFNPVPIQFDWAIAVATLGLAVNLVCALVLGGHDHDHGSAGTGHGHGGEDHNLRSAYLHVIADALTSLLAIVALVAGKYANAQWLDPLLGIAGSVLIVRWTWHLLRQTSGVLLDRRVDEALRGELRQAIEIGTDDRVADLHLWRIGPTIHAAAFRVVSRQPQPPAHYRARIPMHLGVVHSTVEVHRCE